jgi:hypothetical protein
MMQRSGKFKSDWSRHMIHPHPFISYIANIQSQIKDLTLRVLSEANDLNKLLDNSL